jgi:hypothetical protein
MTKAAPNGTVVPVGAGPNIAQTAGLFRRYTVATLGTAVANVKSDPGASPFPAITPSPFDDMTDTPSPNAAALAAAPPGSASVPGLPGRPVAYAPQNLDGADQSTGAVA